MSHGTHMCASWYTHVHVYVYTVVGMCIYVYIYIYMYMCICLCVNIYTYIYRCISVYTDTCATHLLEERVDEQDYDLLRYIFCVTCLIHMCDMTHSCVRHGTDMCASWYRIDGQSWAMTHINKSRDTSE